MFKMKPMISIPLYCTRYSLNNFLLFFIILTAPSCLESKRYDRFGEYLKKVHNVEFYENQELHVIFVNNIDCQPCLQEKIDLILDFIMVEGEKTVGCEFIVHFLKEDPGLDFFNNLENVRGISGDKFSIYKFGIVSSFDFSLLYQNGKVKRTKKLEQR